MFTVLFGYFNLNHTYFWYKFECWWHWNKSSKWKAYLACLYMTFKRDCWEMFVSLLHLCVCRDLLHFMSLLTFYVVERNVVAYFHAHIWRVKDQYWQTSPNESVLLFEVVFVVCWQQIGNLVQLVYITVSLILIELHNFFCQKCVYWWHWNKFSKCKAYFACIYMTFRKDCWQKFVSMLHLCACLDLLDLGRF